MRMKQEGEENGVGKKKERKICGDARLDSLQFSSLLMFFLFFSPLSLTLFLCVECMQHHYHRRPLTDHIFSYLYWNDGLLASPPISSHYLLQQWKKNLIHFIQFQSRRQHLRAAHIMKTSLTRRTLDHGSLARSSEWERSPEISRSTEIILESGFFGAGKWATVWNVHGGWQDWRCEEEKFSSQREVDWNYFCKEQKGDIQLEKFLASSSGCFFALSSFLCFLQQNRVALNCDHSLNRRRWEMRKFLSQGFNWCEDDWGILEKFSSISIDLIEILKKFSFDLRLSSSNLKILKTSATKAITFTY